MAIAQVLEVPTEAEPAPSPVIEVPVRRPTASGWRSRCVATAAYLLTLAGLVAVASLGADDSPSPDGGTAPAAPSTVVVAAP